MPAAASICISIEVPERGKPVTTMTHSASGGISLRSDSPDKFPTGLETFIPAGAGAI